MRKAGSSGAWRRFGTAVAFALWVAVATLFLLELMLFVSRPLWRTPGDLPPAGRGMPTQERYWCYRYQPIVGYTGIPGVTWRAPWGAIVTQNARGERGPDVAYERGGAPRVVVLGDSQAWGFGVADDETLARQLTDALAADDHPGVETVNLGVSGYGIDQSVLAYLLSGEAYSPDLVVFAWFASNDLEEIASDRTHGVAKPLFVMHGEELCLANVPVPRAEGWPDVDLGSQLVRWLTRRAGRTTGALAGKTNLVAFLHTRRGVRDWRPEYDRGLARVRRTFPCVLPGDDGSPRGGPVGARLLGALARELKPRARLVVLGIPTVADLAAGRRSGSYADFLGELSRDGIEIVDPFDELRPLFAAGRAMGRGNQDSHLSAEGTGVVARLLAGRIADELDPPERPGTSAPRPGALRDEATGGVAP